MEPAISSGLELSQVDLLDIFQMKYGYPSPSGPNPRLWLRHGYFVPDDYYEATVAKLVTKTTRWLDIGCGRNIFPQNPRLADDLARRCALLVGLDPDINIEENRWVHERIRGTLNEYRPRELFDLVTLRMVAEHLPNPSEAIASLASLTRPGGRVVVYTVPFWSPAALLAKLVPFRFHHGIKNVLWNTHERDTFPVAYQMNTRRRLTRVFAEGGFREVLFSSIADCRLFYRFRPLHIMELALWRAFRLVDIGYPERCLLGVYERTQENKS